MVVLNKPTRFELHSSEPSMSLSVFNSTSQLLSGIRYLFICLTAFLLSAPVNAEGLVGAKIAKMYLDTPSRKDPVNIAVNVGYAFDSLIADLSLIGEVSRTALSGETGNGNDLDFESESAYLLWKTTRSMFVSLRGGLVRNKTITGSSYHRGDGIVLGASIGVVIGRTRLQIEYTSLAGDANFLGVGLDF
jgi:hypothetical protein